MTLSSYDAQVASGVLRADAEQRAVVEKLQFIGDELKRRRNWAKPSRSLFARWKKTVDESVKGVQGIYLWGGVGRGKTHLCDLFFDAVAVEQKTRLHFHRFMQQIHADLRKLEGVENPLQRIADDWAGRSRLLLLDEIHVNDITDAMLLGGLMSELFKRGVTLVTTSNVPPEGLYKDGLQRARFLPAIAQICRHTDVVEMLGETDFRLQLLQKEPVYRVTQSSGGEPDRAAQSAMQDYFDKARTEHEEQTRSLVVNSRDIPVVARSTDLVWFTFDALCNTNRSTQDYIELASEFHTIMISDVPVMNDMTNDAARRFVNMIDEFYDRHVKLIVSAEASADKLYTGKRLEFEFERAASRLFEMQSTEYLGSERRL